MAPSDEMFIILELQDKFGGKFQQIQNVLRMQSAQQHYHWPDMKGQSHPELSATTYHLSRSREGKNQGFNYISYRKKPQSATIWWDKDPTLHILLSSLRTLANEEGRRYIVSYV